MALIKMEKGPTGPIGPNEGGGNGGQEVVDRVSGPYRKDLRYAFYTEEEIELEQLHDKKIAASREGVEVKITKENVVAGLKFIVEHQDMEQEQLIDELIKLGCNFTMDDVRQFPDEVELSLDTNWLRVGVSMIAQVMVSELNRDYFKERFSSVDGDNSVYYVIREITGDKSYTKEYVDSLTKSEG